MYVLEKRAQLLRHVPAPIFDFFILEYMYNLHKNDDECDELNLSNLAAAFGRVEILKYLWSIGAFYEPYTAENAAINGKIKVLKCLASFGLDLLKFNLLQECHIRDLDLNVIEYLVSIGDDVRTIPPYTWVSDQFRTETIDFARIHEIPIEVKRRWIFDSELPDTIRWILQL